MYTCGPTVYNYAHIGNARPAVVSDLLVRTLRQIYPKVTYVSNITDIDDKIIDKANELNITTDQLVELTQNTYHQNLNSLSILSPTHEPKATNYISKMIEMITSLIDKKFAYISNEHVLFEAKKYKDYGSLSKFSLKDIISLSLIHI